MQQFTRNLGVKLFFYHFSDVAQKAEEKKVYQEIFENKGK